MNSNKCLPICRSNVLLSNSTTVLEFTKPLGAVCNISLHSAECTLIYLKYTVGKQCTEKGLNDH